MESRLMVREDRRGGHVSEVEVDDDTEVIRQAPMPSLKWEDSLFQQQTLSALNQMRKNKHFCDVTLRIGKQDISAHRVVLAASSSYFVSLFTKGEAQPTRREVEGSGIVYELDGFSKEAIERLIDYAYTAVLDVPGDMLRPVYFAATALRLDRAANECARFMAGNIDLTACLELRSTPSVASNKPAVINGHADDDDDDKAGLNGDVKEHNKKNSNENGVTTTPTTTTTSTYGENLKNRQQQRFNLVGHIDDYIASANVKELQTNREFLALPRVCVEVLHATREERDAVLARPLCELVLDWAHRKWLDDDQVSHSTFVKKSSLLFMSNDNSLQDCDEIEEGSAIDSDIIQDYKANNLQQQHVAKVKSKTSRLFVTAKPAKPREMLYSRHINQDSSHLSEDADQYCWKVIAAHRLDDKSILGVVAVDAHLMALSIVQRVNLPSSPPTGSVSGTASQSMTRSCSANSLPPSTRSPLSLSRPPSQEKDVFAPVAHMKQAKCAVGAECLQGNLVVCGGYNRGECLNLVEMYKGEENTWTRLPSMLAKRGRFDVTVMEEGDIVYAVGGSNGQSEECSVEKYDPAVGKWTYCANLPVPLSNIGLCNLDGHIYCIGGSYGSTGSRYCFRFSPDQDKWERIANLHVGRFQAAVTSFQGRIWAVGGCESWNPLNSLEIYDPATNTWKMGPPLHSPRRGCGLAVRNGQLIVVGGTDGTQSMCTTEILDLTENAWRAGPTMTTCRANVGVAMVGDRLWAVGGFTGKAFLNSAEYLDGDSDEWTTFITVVDKDDENPPAPPPSTCTESRRDSEGELEEPYALPSIVDDNQEPVENQEKIEVVVTMHNQETEQDEPDGGGGQNGEGGLTYCEL